MPRGCHQAAHCNLIKMGKERIVCVWMWAWGWMWHGLLSSWGWWFWRELDVLERSIPRCKKTVPFHEPVCVSPSTAPTKMKIKSSALKTLMFYTSNICSLIGRAMKKHQHDRLWDEQCSAVFLRLGFSKFSKIIKRDLFLFKPNKPCNETIIKKTLNQYFTLKVLASLILLRMISKQYGK